MQTKDKIPLECLDVVRRFNTYGLNIKSKTDLDHFFYTVKKDRRFKKWCKVNGYRIKENLPEDELAAIVSEFKRHVDRDFKALIQFILHDSYDPYKLNEVYFDSLSDDQREFIFACFEISSD